MLSIMAVIIIPLLGWIMSVEIIKSRIIVHDKSIDQNTEDVKDMNGIIIRLEVNQDILIKNQEILIAK